VVEIIIAVLQGKSPSLRFYATAYNILGNTALGGGIWIILIIIIGNIINGRDFKGLQQVLSTPAGKALSETSRNAAVRIVPAAIVR
jgi:hypothetical protein